MNNYVVIDTGNSRSFEAGHSFIQGASANAAITVYIGKDAGSKYVPDAPKLAILIELGTECLGVHTGESPGSESSNVLGFSRFRLGDLPATNLVEVVMQIGRASCRERV